MRPELSPEARRLADIRRRLELARADGSRDWQQAWEGTGRAIVNGDGTPIAAMTREATAEEFELAAGAPGDIAFLLDLVDRAAAKVREMDATLLAFRNANPLPGEVPGQSKNYAAEASIKLDDLHFRQFLRWHPDARPVGGASGDRDAKEIAADRLRAILGIASRKQLNTEPRAAQGWLALRDEWKRFQAMSQAEREAAYPGYGSSMREAAQ